MKYSVSTPRGCFMHPLCEPSMPVLRTQAGILCDITYEVNMVENVQETIDKVTEAIEYIQLINAKIEKLRTDTSSLRQHLKAAWEHHRIYSTFNNLGKEFEECVGTLSAVKQRIFDYSKKLNEEYEVPKQKLENTHKEATAQLEELLTEANWVMEHTLYVDQETPTFIIRSR